MVLESISPSLSFDYNLFRMQAQSGFLLRQLGQLLRHRKYKYVVTRVERLLERQEDLQYFCLEFHVRLRLLQLQALARLFERNLLKKYKYPLPLLEFLVELTLRNLAYCHQALRDKAREKTFFNRLGNATDSSLPRAAPSLKRQNNSIEDCFAAEERKKNRNYSIRLATGLDSQARMAKFVRKFFEAANRSIVLILQSFLVYRLEFDEGILTEYIKGQRECRFRSVEGSLSLMGLQLFHAKLQFLSQDRAAHLRCEQTLEGTIEGLIDALHQINVARGRSRPGERGRQCEGQREAAQRLMAVALAVSNKARMKLGKESVAVAGVELFQSFLQGLPAPLKNFRRLMLPELYLQEQFLRYRAEKAELAELIAPFFPEKGRQAQEANQERERARDRLMDFYNRRNADERAATAERGRQRPFLGELSTAKSIVVTRHKATIQARGGSREGHEGKNRIIANMIASDIAEINSNYLKFKKITPKTQRQKENSKSYFYKNNVNTGKRQSTTRLLDESLTEREKSLFIQQGQYRSHVQGQKQRLRRKRRQVRLEEQEGGVGEQALGVREQLGTLLAAHKYTEEKSAQPEERELRRNVLAITARRKADLFLEVLFLNREPLGIKKLAEKAEALRKKELEKAKSTNGRLTSSMNREQARGSFVKFEVIAKELIRKHISFAYDQPLAVRSPAQHLQFKRRAIQANYVLGQRSIEAVREKLETKINKSDGTVDKYLRNEEVFKLKLKKLGTTNFILKKAEERAERNEKETGRERVEGTAEVPQVEEEDAEAEDEDEG